MDLAARLRAPKFDAYGVVNANNALIGFGSNRASAEMVFNQTPGARLIGITIHELPEGEG